VTRFKLSYIDRYILTELARPLLGIMGVVYFLFYMGQVLRLADFVIVRHVPGSIIIQMSAYIMTSLSTFVFPISFLASTLIAFGRLSSDSELVALKACGISIFRLARPLLVVAVLIAAISMSLSMYISPWAEVKLAEAMIRAGDTKVTVTLKEKTFNSGFYDLLLYADRIDPDTGRMENVFIHDEREANQPMEIVASEGILQHLTTRSTFGKQVVLRLQNGKIYQIESGKASAQVIGFEKYSLYLKIDEAEAFNPGKPRMLNANHLWEMMRIHPKSSQAWRDRATEFWKRFFTSLTPFVFVFLGIGLGTTRGRTTQGRGILITFVTMLLYYVALMYSNDAGNAGRIPVIFALSIPYQILTAIAAWAMRRAAW